MAAAAEIGAIRQSKEKERLPGAPRSLGNPLPGERAG